LQGTKWSSWEVLEDEYQTTEGFHEIPAVVSEGAGKLGFYAQRYENSSIAYKQWDGSKFVPSGKTWLHVDIPDLGSEYVRSFSISSPTDRPSQHLWVQTSNATLFHATLRGSTFSGLESLGDASSALPFVSHQDAISIDITGYIWDTGKVAVRSFDGKKWGGWQTVKSGLGYRESEAAPAVAYYPPNNVHVFDVTVVSKYGVVANHKNNGTWSPKLDEVDPLVQFYSFTSEKTNFLSGAASAVQQVFKQWL
jgi:hypothetical protein